MGVLDQNGFNAAVTQTWLEWISDKVKREELETEKSELFRGRLYSESSEKQIPKMGLNVPGFL